MATAMTVCSFPDCGRPASRRSGLCRAHGDQRDAGRDLRPIVKQKLPLAGTFCSFPGCGRPTFVRGLCKSHYDQQKKGDELHAIGDPAWRGRRQREAWARLSPEERRERMAPAVANLHKRGEGWRLNNSRAKQQAWADGTILPQGERQCRTCRKAYIPRAGAQMFCSIVCRNTSTRARMYGVDLDEFVRLERDADGACALCRKRNGRLYADHDHASGRFRGFLCMPCNTGLGKLGDSVERLREAIAYLER